MRIIHADTVTLKDTKKSIFFTLNKWEVEEFIENYERPNDLVVVVND